MAFCAPERCCAVPITTPPGPEIGASWSCVNCRSTYVAIEVTPLLGSRVFEKCIRAGIHTVWFRDRRFEEVDEQPYKAPSGTDAPKATADRPGMVIDVPPMSGDGAALHAGIKGSPLRR
jgi:hypothetical protein